MTARDSVAKSVTSNAVCWWLAAAKSPASDCAAVPTSSCQTALSARSVSTARCTSGVIAPSSLSRMRLWRADRHLLRETFAIAGLLAFADADQRGALVSARWSADGCDPAGDAGRGRALAGGRPAGHDARH